jgi:hypothetical protein
VCCALQTSFHGRICVSMFNAPSDNERHVKNS